MKIVIDKPLPTANQVYTAHWRVYKRIVDEFKNLTLLALRGLPHEKFADKVEIEIIVYQETKRRRDCDNVFAKPVIDTIVKWGIIEDDNWTVVEGVTLRIKHDKISPRTEVHITAR